MGSGGPCMHALHARRQRNARVPPHDEVPWETWHPRDAWNAWYPRDAWYTWYAWYPRNAWDAWCWGLRGWTRDSDGHAHALQEADGVGPVQAVVHIDQDRIRILHALLSHEAPEFVEVHSQVLHLSVLCGVEWG